MIAGYEKGKILAPPFALLIVQLHPCSCSIGTEPGSKFFEWAKRASKRKSLESDLAALKTQKLRKGTFCHGVKWHIRVKLAQLIEDILTANLKTSIRAYHEFK